MKVYAIAQANTGLVKVGVSRDPLRRLSGIRTSSPHELRLEHAVEVDDAYAVERVAHSMLAEWRVAGEWFNVSIEQARAAINLASEDVHGIKAPVASLDAQPRPKRSREFTRTFTMRASPEFMAMLSELAECEGGYPLPTHSDLIRQAVDEKLALLLAAKA